MADTKDLLTRIKRLAAGIGVLFGTFGVGLNGEIEPVTPNFGKVKDAELMRTSSWPGPRLTMPSVVISCPASVPWNVIV